MESSTSSQPNQPYSPINLTNLDLNFEFPFDDDEDNSSAKEVSPVKPKKPSKRAAKTKKDDPKEGKEAPKEWTVAEEIALCQGWCNILENSISGNNMKAKGFWEAVI
nr:hypothetical protein [Tanacetum cinerariifolium]